MLLPNVRKVMSALREKGRYIRSNNKRIDEWVDRYINQCALEGRSVTILTQWCIAKDLEVRFRIQNGFTPTKAELTLFRKVLPAIARLFEENGISVDWFLTFNRSYLDLGRVDGQIEKAYTRMIAELANPLEQQGWLECLNWEDDILGSRPEPNEEVFASIDRFVSVGALQLEVERHAPWSKESGLNQTDEELERDVCFKIACEAEEGRLLVDPDWFFGECIIMPLESQERYDFFGLKAPSIKNRVVAILPPYPWRFS